MTNKLLAIFALTPIAILFGTGFMEGLTMTDLTSDGFDMAVSLVMIIFVTWALVRLYQTKD